MPVPAKISKCGSCRILRIVTKLGDRDFGDFFGSPRQNFGWSVASTWLLSSNCLGQLCRSWTVGGV